MPPDTYEMFKLAVGLEAGFDLLLVDVNQFLEPLMHNCVVQYTASQRANSTPEISTGCAKLLC